MTPSGTDRPTGVWSRRLIVALYVPFLIAVVWGLFATRQWALETLDSDVERTRWEDYLTKQRDALASGKSPVQRRLPRTATSPTLVLMRDRFGVCLTGGIVLSSTVYFATALLICGALTPTRPPLPD